MKIAIGCDPNAQKEKEELIDFIKEKGLGDVTDFGSEDPVYEMCIRDSLQQKHF